MGVHGFHLLLRFVLVRRSFWAYLLLSFPALLIEFWFERIGRPTYVEGTNGQELKRAGEDLEAKGLTEWMWDVVYWSWGCLVFSTVLGDWVWWFYVSGSPVNCSRVHILLTRRIACRASLLGLVGIYYFHRCSSRSHGWWHARSRGLRVEWWAEQAPGKDGEERRPEDAIQVVCEINSSVVWHHSFLLNSPIFLGYTSF